MPRLTTYHTTWIVTVAVALMVCLAVGAWWQSRLEDGRQFYLGDSASNWELGRSVARGEPYQYRSPEARVFPTPGYPLPTAGLQLVLTDRPQDDGLTEALARAAG